MNRRGAILIFGLLVVLVLSILAAAFYSKALNENNLTRRHIESARAFWLAEAGIAEAINNLPNLNTLGSIGNVNYTYNAQAQLLGDGVYEIVSTGSVIFPNMESISRTLRVNVKIGEVNAGNFQYAIETTTELVIKGSVEINPAEKKKEFSTLDFAALFGYAKADLRDNATHLYTPEDFGEPAVDGITWVDVPAGETLTIAGNLEGSGILIISGDVHFAGTVDFNGIIYVIGELTITGDVTANGSVLAESSTTVDTTLKGNVTLTWDMAQINAALDAIRFLSKDIVSWREM